MIKARVLKPFITDGRRVCTGSIICVNEDALDALGDLVKVLPYGLSDSDQIKQQHSADWQWFCDSHERSLPDCYCQAKHDRLDPMAHCVGWQLKNGKRLH